MNEENLMAHIENLEARLETAQEDLRRALDAIEAFADKASSIHGQGQEDALREVLKVLGITWEGDQAGFVGFAFDAIRDIGIIQAGHHDGTHAFDDGARFACTFLKDHPDPAVRRIQLDISAGCIAKRRAREAKAGT